MGFATDFSVTVYCDFCKGQTEEITCMDTTSLAKAWTYAKKHGWEKIGDKQACPVCAKRLKSNKGE